MEYTSAAQHQRELDAYTRSMRDYLANAGDTRSQSPEFVWKDLSANSAQFSNVKSAAIKTTGSSKKNYSK